MNEFWCDLGLGVLASTVGSAVWFLLLLGLVYIVARRWIVSRRSRLIRLLGLNPEKPEVTVYLSRHAFATTLPRIEIPPNARDSLTSLERIASVQEQEDLLLKADLQAFTPKPFKAVAAVEMFEFLRLQSFLSRPAWIERLPVNLQSQLHRLEPRTNRIKINFDICPDKVEEFAPGSLILIGGPRANHATFYFCYGKEACQVRLGRVDKDKHTAFILDGSGQDMFPPKQNANLGIIERFTDNGRAILYLGGSGIRGTAASVEYLMMNWQEILDKAADRDFAYVISCAARTGTESLSYYINREWQDSDWVTIHRHF